MYQRIQSQHGISRFGFRWRLVGAIQGNKKEMTFIHSYDTNLFGPVKISSLSLEEASPEEMNEHLRARKNKAMLVQRGHQRSMEKLRRSARVS